MMSSRPGFLSFAVFLVIVVMVSVAYIPTSTHIVNEWVYNGPYTHGSLAFVLALVVAWQRKALVTLSLQFDLIPTAGILMSSLLWLAGVISNTFLFAVIGQFGVLVAAVWICFSFSGVLKLAPVLACILLVLPVWNVLQVPLQHLSIVVTHVTLDLIGIPTLKQGIYFTVPGGRFAVETACSGLGFFLCSVLLAIIYSHFNQYSLAGSMWLLLFSILLALISNWVRIIVIMLVGNYTNMDHPIVTDHLTFGWVVFSLALILFYWFANRVITSKVSEPVQTEVEESEPPAPARLITVAVLVLAIPLVGLYLDAQQAVNNGNSSWAVQMLNAKLGRSSSRGPVVVKPNFVGASEIWQGHYRLEGAPLSALVVRYDQQEQGSELIYYDNSVVDVDRWQAEETLSTAFDQKPRKVTYVDPAGNRRIVYSWYLIGSHLATTESVAKLYELLAFVEGDRTAYLVALVMDRPGEPQIAAMDELAAQTMAEMLEHRAAQR